MRYGTRVRTRRIVLGMSQESLAHELRVTFQQVQKYEKGANRISAGPLQQVSTILQVPITYFYEGLPSAKKQNDYVTKIAATEKVSKL